ncbi:ABC transporter ATP-binding protein [Bacteroidota bacterium]
MPLIELKNISFSYLQSSQSSNFSLEGINLIINKGDFISILGPNGCGKSTLLKLIARLLNPQDGHILFSDVEYQKIPRKNFTKKIAYVPQTTYSIYPFSVFEVVMMGRTPYLNLLGFESGEDIDIVEETLEKVGILNLRHKGINEISGGEAQRAFIARALVQTPEIILLDEPNAHLDIEHQMEIFNLLNFLNKNEKLTVVAVSHDLNLVGLFSERALLMKSGKIILDSDKKSILTESNIKEIFNVNSIVRYNQDSDSLLVNIIPNPH